MWGWLEWKFNKRKKLDLPQIHWKIQTTHRKQYLFSTDPFVVWPPTHTGIILLLLPVCSHHHCCHHTVAAQHSFRSETMISTNKKMYDTPTKKRTVSRFWRLKKKRTTSEVLISPVFESSLSTASTVSAWSLTDLCHRQSLSLLSAVSKTSSLSSTTLTIKTRLTTAVGWQRSSGHWQGGEDSGRQGQMLWCHSLQWQHQPFLLPHCGCCHHLAPSSLRRWNGNGCNGTAARGQGQGQWTP